MTSRVFLLNEIVLLVILVIGVGSRNLEEIAV